MTFQGYVSISFSTPYFLSIYSNCHSFISGDGADEGPSRQVCGQQGGDPLVLQMSRD